MGKRKFWVENEEENEEKPVEEKLKRVREG